VRARGDRRDVRAVRARGDRRLLACRHKL